MNPFLKSESLAAVFIVVNQRVYRSIRGERRNLAILYLGTKKRIPANADAELLKLHGEVANEDKPGHAFAPEVVPTAEPPWTLTVHLEDTGLSDLDGDDKIHHWIARDFKPRPAENGPPIAAAGEQNQAHLIFEKDPPEDFDAIDNLEAIKAKAKDPTWVTLYATESDTQSLGEGAGDYGSARDLDA